MRALEMWRRDKCSTTLAPTSDARAHTANAEIFDEKTWKAMGRSSLAFFRERVCCVDPAGNLHPLSPIHCESDFRPLRAEANTGLSMKH